MGDSLRRASTGAVACGHPATAEAALEILQAGGNAYDAAIAAMCTAVAAEPVFFSLAGGGFLVAQPADSKPLVYDFFVATPKTPARDPSTLDFAPIVADFGTATQEFHIGLGSTATPGAVRGLFAIHRDLASMPLTELVAPALHHARQGVTLREVDAYLFSVVGAILTARADSRAAYTNRDGKLLVAGESVVQRDFADSLETIAREGEALFYEGEIAEAICRACKEQGGLLTREDLADYRVIRRAPLACHYRGARILTNPPASTGGLLIAFKLSIMQALLRERQAFGSPAWVETIGRTMALTNRARAENPLREESESATAHFLSEELRARYVDVLDCHPESPRGTTHISVIDGDGNLAALSLSNGEGNGYVLPGTGIMLNNMLGEQDLNPEGFHLWTPGTRLASMMAPSVATLADGRLTALGSGGSNRIRTAIFQVLVNLIDQGMSLEQAVDAPRLHVEHGVANAEGALAETCRQVLASASEPFADSVTDWPRHNLFFGGVHAASRSAEGVMTAAGDPRRGGAVAVA